MLVAGLESDTLVYNGHSQMPVIIFTNAMEEIEYTSRVVAGDSINVSRTGAIVEFELTEEFANNYDVATNQFNYYITYRTVIVSHERKHVLFIDDETCYTVDVTEDMLINATDIDTVSGTLSTVSGKINVYNIYNEFNYKIKFTRDGKDVTGNYIINISSYVAIRHKLFETEVVTQEGDVLSYN